MSDPSKYQSFTAADIERYYNGTMPAVERHALEKAALDDPFLADALEGYALTSTPVADIDAIKKRLEEKHKRKIIPLFSKNYKWLQIAALFLLLAGSGWFLYKADFFNKKEIAVATPKQEPPQTFSKAKSKDTPNPVNAVPLQESQPVADQTQKTVAITPKNKPVNQQAQKKVVEEKHRIETADVAAATVQQHEQTETRSLTRKMPANNKDMAAATSPVERNNNAIVYNSRTADTITDSASGYARLQGKIIDAQPANDTVRLNVTMQPSKESMSEVVVVDLKGKKAARAIPAAKFEELEPAEGWSNFNEYIAQNLKQPEDVKEKTASGEVELSFEVNKEGQAVNIRVEKSLCGDCDKEAVRLLKEGPKWKKKKDKKGKVTIHF
jgi:outer membrane biosynthesis protein TonB